MSDRWVRICRSSFLHQERGDCVVRAIAFATGVSYDAVHAELEAAGRYPRCGTYWPDALKAVSALGYAHRWHLLQKSRTAVTAERELRERFSGRPGLLSLTEHASGWDGSMLADWERKPRRRAFGFIELMEKGDERD